MKNKTLLLLEEIFNSISHGIGAILATIGLIILLVVSKENILVKNVSYIIFGLSLILMYIISTLFHSLKYTKANKIFRIFDQISIFLLIAGTYTPFALLALKGWISVALLSYVWSVSIVGIIFTAIFVNRLKGFFVILYLLLGWSAILVIKPLFSALSPFEIMLLFSGGMFYTAGCIFFAWKKLPFNHTIWHLFVIAGSICHFLLVYLL